MSSSQIADVTARVSALAATNDSFWGRTMRLNSATLSGVTLTGKFDLHPFRSTPP
jgi:hypothetical protein